MFPGGLTHPEIEAMVGGIREVPIEAVGSAAWKHQRHTIEQLNVVSHTCATEKRDDVVLSNLVSAEGKLRYLLNDLLVMEVWRHRILPNVNRELNKHPAGMYMYCYYEGVLVNFLECIMFHEEAVTAIGDDILELIDYCWRNIAAFLIADESIGEIQLDNARAAMEESEEVRFKKQMRELNISRSLSCISVLWFIIDRSNKLPLSVTNSLLQKNDVLIGFTHLIDCQPWMRRDKNTTQKFIQGQWKPVSRQDAFSIVPQEAHAWFAIHFLLCDRQMRQKYQYSKHKKDTIMTLKRFLNETIVDQIPSLVDVQRAIEELSFMEPPSGTEEKFKASLVIEQLPTIITVIEGGRKGKNWMELSRDFLNRALNPQAAQEDAARMAKLFDMMLPE